MHSRRTPLPEISLGDPIWTVEHIALALRQQTRATRTLIGRPDFPPAFRLCDAPNARKYWLRETVLAYLPTLLPVAPVSIATGPKPTTTPGPTELAAPVQTAVDPHAAALAKIAALPHATSRRAS
ncbi:hypothetical protein [Cellulomonas alba]|uniref:DNA-binding protein n=1 Tax=Cellulomonas alba TaxID=3053467 RepID=A0ABT7SBS7_9CELL|nr:hypothetical protein [Cellulomonas alba]MDM7853646.1 hypothetical protein [Cellulomonas alba]